jgi:hypothetical protein
MSIQQERKCRFIAGLLMVAGIVVAMMVVIQ